MTGQKKPGGTDAAAAAGKVVEAALNFESWVHGNVGTTSDFPAHILCDNIGAADGLACLLSELTRACSRFRELSTAGGTGRAQARE